MNGAPVALWMGTALAALETLNQIVESGGAFARCPHLRIEMWGTRLTLEQSSVLDYERQRCWCVFQSLFSKNTEDCLSSRIKTRLEEALGINTDEGEEEEE